MSCYSKKSLMECVTQIEKLFSDEDLLRSLKESDMC